MSLCFMTNCTKSKASVDISENIILNATIANFEKQNNTNVMYLVDENNNEYIIYNWTKYIIEGTQIRTGNTIQIVYSGEITDDGLPELHDVISISSIEE